MLHCRDCPFFSPHDRTDLHPSIMGRCTSPIFAGNTSAYVSGNTPEIEVPCRLHTGKF